MGEGASGIIISIQGKDLPDELTEAEQAEVEAAEKLPPVFDEDCPPMTEEHLRLFVRMNRAIPKHKAALL